MYALASLVLENISPSNEKTHFPAVLFIRKTHSALLGVLKTHSVQQGSVVIELSGNTQTTNISTSSYPSVPATVKLVLLRYPGRRHPDADMFRRLEQRLRETGSVTRSAHVNAGRSRSVRTPPMKMG
jgi:hypothetical protein